MGWLGETAEPAPRRHDHHQRPTRHRNTDRPHCLIAPRAWAPHDTTLVGWCPGLQDVPRGSPYLIGRGRCEGGAAVGAKAGARPWTPALFSLRVAAAQQ